MYLAIDSTPGQGNFIRIQDVKAIQCEEGQWIAIANDGTIHATEWIDVVRATATIVPAAPGEIVCRVYTSNGKSGTETVTDIDRHSIIAWAVSPFMQPVPITSVGYLVDVFSSEERQIVLTRTPDGKCRSFEGHTFGSLLEAGNWLDEGGPKWLRTLTQSRPVPYPKGKPAWVAAASQPIPDDEARLECMQALNLASLEYFIG
jgi:hypothetical protein